MVSGDCGAKQDTNKNRVIIADPGNLYLRAYSSMYRFADTLKPTAAFFSIQGLNCLVLLLTESAIFLYNCSLSQPL